MENKEGGNNLGGDVTPEVSIIYPERYAWADLCRVFAIYGVVLIHSSGVSFYQYEKLPVFSWLQSVIVDSFVRCSVPLFVMLSGALILVGNGQQNKIPYELHQIPRRLSRVLLPLLVWSALYLTHIARSGGGVKLASIFFQPAMYHLWFVYMICGIYLLLPILSSVFSRFSQSLPLQIYFFAIWFSITAFPVYYDITFFSLLQLNGLFGYGGYFLIGAFLVAHGAIPFSTLAWCTFFLANVAVTIFLTWYLSELKSAPVETAFLYFSPNVVLASLAAFVVLSRVRINKLWSRFFAFLSEMAFFVYFVHVIVLEYVRYNSVIIAVSENLPVGVSILLLSIITFLSSLIIAWLVRLIPGGGRVFG